MMRPLWFSHCYSLILVMYTFSLIARASHVLHLVECKKFISRISRSSSTPSSLQSYLMRFDTRGSLKGNMSIEPSDMIAKELCGVFALPSLFLIWKLSIVMGFYYYNLKTPQCMLVSTWGGLYYMSATKPTPSTIAFYAFTSFLAVPCRVW